MFSQSAETVAAKSDKLAVVLPNDVKQERDREWSLRKPNRHQAVDLKNKNFGIPAGVFDIAGA